MLKIHPARRDKVVSPRGQRAGAEVLLPLPCTVGSLHQDSRQYVARLFVFFGSFKTTFCCMSFWGAGIIQGARSAYSLLRCLGKDVVPLCPVPETSCSRPKMVSNGSDLRACRVEVSFFLQVPGLGLSPQVALHFLSKVAIYW